MRTNTTRKKSGRRAVALVSTALVVSSLLASDIAAPAVPLAVTDPPREESSLTQHSISVNGRERRYWIDLPKDLPEHGTHPLIVAFAGKDVSPTDFAKASDLGHASQGRAILVYPEQVKGAWEGAPYSTVKRGTDVEFIRELIDELRHTFPIDEDKILAVGHSNGGAMVGGLMCQAPELVDAAVIVAGAFYAGILRDCAPPRPIPVAQLHDSTDPVIAFQGGMRWDTELLPSAEAFSYIARRNGCHLWLLRQEDQAPNAVKTTPLSCDAPTTFTRVEGEGHSWTHQPNAADIAWELLEFDGAQ